MKMRLMVLIVGMLTIGLLAGCGANNTPKNTNTGASNQPSPQVSTQPSANESEKPAEDPTINIDKLKVSFVPSKDPDEIITTTEPLKQLLISQLATQGYEVGDVQIDVGTTYEAVGEALSAGTTDVGLIPGGRIRCTMTERRLS